MRKYKNLSQKNIGLNHHLLFQKQTKNNKKKFSCLQIKTIMSKVRSKSMNK